MKQLVLIPAIILALVAGCHSSNESLDEAETTSFSNSLHIVDFKAITKDTRQGKEGFTLSFTVTASDKTRSLDKSTIQLDFPQEIGDEHGNTFIRQGNTVLQQHEDKPHVIKVSQFFTGKPAENTSHLSVPARLVISNLNKTVRFHNVTRDMVPVTRQELTINKLEWNAKELTLEAEDIFSMANTEWSLLKNDEKIYPVFSNTDTTEDGEFQGTLEFAFQPKDRFTLVAERNRTRTKEWELPFVVPVE
ncbi:hypothetical protein D7Z54_22875 [Salibacterium salarium]|uniref:DUF5643 domain-containing protein n=1 Tax=Salibacterium salarium TaxID=284579 RepID=A0A428MXV7_9BACI|nr:hypothetical protein [Salibacterium salarium]RSL30993.1 hypothetical protein D7Z54_22875 [Salibacterium salarium]